MLNKSRCSGRATSDVKETGIAENELRTACYKHLRLFHLGVGLSAGGGAGGTAGTHLRDALLHRRQAVQQVLHQVRRVVRRLVAARNTSAPEARAELSGGCSLEAGHSCTQPHTTVVHQEPSTS